MSGNLTKVYVQKILRLAKTEHHYSREESHLNSVARTFMMELDDDMLESIRDEMQPLAEKWFKLLSFIF